MPEQYITNLFSRFFQGIISLEEKETLAGWIQESGEEDQLKNLMEKSWQEFEPQETLSAGKASELLKAIILEAKLHEPASSKLVSLPRRKWFRVAAAAAIIILLSGGSYFLFFNKPSQSAIVKTPVPQDIKAPVTNRAMITLTNGQKVFLDSANNGTLAQQGNIKLVKLSNGQIAYQASPSPSEGAVQIQYNTLSNPRGSKVIDMTLADGSHVWLNAGSSVTYPVSFIGNQRKVSITGEAYFEVSHDASKPFTVSKGETSVQVLGTHFNVNAYDDEADIKVTLLEGLVKILRQAQDDKAVILKPGQQAQVSSDIKVADNVDADEIMAWKNNRFVFNSADIKTITRQLARWYDVDIAVQADIPNHFTGIITRDAKASEVFAMLQKTGTMKVSIEGRRIVITK